MIYGGLLILLLLAAATIVVSSVVALIVASSRTGLGEGLYCGRCGYSTQGLTLDRCPECGSDFNVVGLRDRPSGLNWGAVLVVLAWAILSPFVLFVAAISVLANAPQYVLKQDFEIWHQPASGAYERVHIDHNATSRTRWFNPEPILTRSTWQVAFQRGPETLDVRGDLMTGWVEVSDRRSTRTLRADLSAALIADLLVGAFPESDSGRLTIEARDVHDRLAYRIDPTLTEPTAASLGRINNSAGSSWRTPIWTYTFAVLAFSALLWIAGIILIVRWSLRRQARQDP